MLHLDEICLDDINIKTDVCLRMPYGIYTIMNLYLEQLPPFQKICYYSLYCGFILQSDLNMTMFLFLSAFTSSAVSLLLTKKVYVFFFIVCMLQSSVLMSSA